MLIGCSYSPWFDKCDDACKDRWHPAQSWTASVDSCRSHRLGLVFDASVRTVTDKRSFSRLKRLSDGKLFEVLGALQSALTRSSDP